MTTRRRRSAWEDSRININVASGAQGFTDLMGTLTEDLQQGRTVVRMVGELTINSQTTAGAWGLQVVDIGVGIIDRDAFAVQEFPDPNSEDDQPSTGWLYRLECLAYQNGVGVEPVIRCPFDIRSQRKIGNGNLTIIVDNTAHRGTAFAIDVRGLVRVLWLLP